MHAQTTLKGWSFDKFWSLFNVPLIDEDEVDPFNPIGVGAIGVIF